MVDLVNFSSIYIQHRLRGWNGSEQPNAGSPSWKWHEAVFQRGWIFRKPWNVCLQPLQKSSWKHRMGMCSGNRMFLGTSYWQNDRFGKSLWKISMDCCVWLLFLRAFLPPEFSTTKGEFPVIGIFCHSNVPLCTQPHLLGRDECPQSAWISAINQAPDVHSQKFRLVALR